MPPRAATQTAAASLAVRGLENARSMAAWSFGSLAAISSAAIRDVAGSVGRGRGCSSGKRDGWLIGSLKQRRNFCFCFGGLQELRSRVEVALLKLDPDKLSLGKNRTHPLAADSSEWG